MTDRKKPTAKATRVPRWMKIVLGLSLALNLLIFGMVVGAAMRGGGPKWGGPAMSNYALPYVHALPRADRRAVFQQLRGAEGQGMPNRKTRNGHYQQMIAALSADSFDRAAVEAILKQQSDMSVAVVTAAQQAWLVQVAQMDDASRKAYALRIQEFLDNRRARKGSKKQ